MADPRTFDGDPYEVASRAVRQAEAVTRILATAVDGAHVMTRNAELERQLVVSGECDAIAYEDSAENRRWVRINEAVQQVQKDLAVLVKVAGFNPKGRLDG